MKSLTENHRRVVCFGDSITHAQDCAEADRWTTQLAFQLEQASPGRFEVFNRGIGGNTTALALDRIQNDVISLLPGLVLIEFGINDAYVFPWAKIPRVALPGYMENLAEILRQVRAAQGEAVLIINHPITTRTDQHPQGNNKSVGANLEPYSQEARAWARNENLTVIDLPELLKQEVVSMEEFWSDDGVHLSPLGNRLYANFVFSSLVKTNVFQFNPEK
jgi:lysophospholipase L1-like esterase